MPELPTSSGETPTATPEPARSEQGAPRSLADLLREEPEPQAGESPAPGPAGEIQAKPKPKRFTDLAEALDMKPEELYALEIPIAEGESLTIGKLKDKAREFGELTERELRFEETKTRREGELLAAQQELQTLIAALPKDAVKPEVIEQVRRKHEAVLKRERALTLDAIPEWRDEATRTRELGEIVEHLKGYGFAENYLASVSDHRTIRYIRDNWRREQRVRKALAQVEKAKPPATTRAKPHGPAPKPGGVSRNQTTRSRLLDLLGN